MLNLIDLIKKKNSSNLYESLRNLHCVATIE